VINRKTSIAILVVVTIILLIIPSVHIIPSIGNRNNKITSIETLDNNIPIYYVGHDYRIISSFQNVIINPSQLETGQPHITIIDLRYMDTSSALKLVESAFHSKNPFILIGAPEAINELITHQKPAIFSSFIGMIHEEKSEPVSTASNIIVYGYIPLSKGTSVTVSVVDINYDTSTFIQGIHEVYTKLASNLNTLTSPSNQHIDKKTFSYHELLAELNQKL